MSENDTHEPSEDPQPDEEHEEEVDEEGDEMPELRKRFPDPVQHPLAFVEDLGDETGEDDDDI